MIGYPSVTFDDANKVAAELIPNYRDLEQKLILACHGVVNAVISDGIPAEIAEDQFFDSIRYTMQNIGEIKNYCSFLRTHIRLRCIDTLRGVKAGREALAKINPKEYRDAIQGSQIPADVITIIREMEMPAYGQEEMAL